VDGDTCTSPSREPRWASLRCDRSVCPHASNRSTIASRSHSSSPCSGDPPGAASDRSAPAARRACHRATRESSTSSRWQADLADQPCATA
jgi:hypothetical protein